jgi:cob(I)alamin adenosyltransferase
LDENTGNGQSPGLVLVYTGNGKGKTTASLGIALRAMGYNLKVCMIQFVKGAQFTGELNGGRLLAPNFRIIRGGKGFVRKARDRKTLSQHIAAATKTLRTSKKIISSGKYDIVILDEINYAMSRKLIRVRPVLELIREKPERVNLVLTGRGAPRSIINAADLVTEMRKVKHPYDRGVPARRGIDL